MAIFTDRKFLSRGLQGAHFNVKSFFGSTLKLLEEQNEPCIPDKEDKRLI